MEMGIKGNDPHSAWPGPNFFLFPHHRMMLRGWLPPNTHVLFQIAS